MIKSDIKDREGIIMVVDLFYNRVQSDVLLSHMFAHVNWDEHLPKMYAFWENVLFHTGGYNGNPMAKHQKVHAKFPLSHDHFMQWIQLFIETVDELFKGPNAQSLKERAKNIATIMEIKILE